MTPRGPDEIVTNWADDMNVHIDVVPRAALTRITREWQIPDLLDAVCQEVAERLGGAMPRRGAS